MISAVDSVGIREKGLVELEHSHRDAYTKVLLLATSSFLADAAYRINKK